MCLVGVFENLLTGVCLYLSNQLVYSASLQMGLVIVYNCLTFFVPLCKCVPISARVSVFVFVCVCSFCLLMLEGLCYWGPVSKNDLVSGPSSHV